MYRLRTLTALSFCLALGGATSEAQNQASPLGMILQAKGDVQVQRQKEKKAARLGDLLYAGDQVVTAAGEATFVFCPSMERISLKDNATVELAAQNLKLVKGTTPARQKAGACALRQVALGAESLERVGALRARGYPPIPLYLGGAVRVARPVFQWGPVKDAKTFHLTVRDEMGGVIWEHDTDMLSAAYPESRPPLAEKTYQWEVRAQSEGKIVGQQAANFTVKLNPGFSPESAANLADRFLLATELENAGYFSEAAASFRELRQETPDDIRLTHHLVWLYWSAGLIAATNEEQERLKTLEGK